MSTKNKMFARFVSVEFYECLYKITKTKACRYSSKVWIVPVTIKPTPSTSLRGRWEFGSFFLLQIANETRRLGSIPINHQFRKSKTVNFLNRKWWIIDGLLMEFLPKGETINTDPFTLDHSEFYVHWYTWLKIREKLLRKWLLCDPTFNGEKQGLVGKIQIRCIAISTARPKSRVIFFYFIWSIKRTRKELIFEMNTQRLSSTFMEKGLRISEMAFSSNW